MSYLIKTLAQKGILKIIPLLVALINLPVAAMQNSRLLICESNTLPIGDLSSLFDQSTEMNWIRYSVIEEVAHASRINTLSLYNGIFVKNVSFDEGFRPRLQLQLELEPQNDAVLGRDSRSSLIVCDSNKYLSDIFWLSPRQRLLTALRSSFLPRQLLVGENYTLDLRIYGEGFLEGFHTVLGVFSNRRGFLKHRYFLSEPRSYPDTPQKQLYFVLNRLRQNMRGDYIFDEYDSPDKNFSGVARISLETSQIDLFKAPPEKFPQGRRYYTVDRSGLYIIWIESDKDQKLALLSMTRVKDKKVVQWPQKIALLESITPDKIYFGTDFRLRLSSTQNELIDLHSLFMDSSSPGS